MRSKLFPVVAVAGLALLGAGCLVSVHEVSDPTAAFREARTEAERYAGRRGPARQLNVLVWDHHDGELVRVSLPMWLVKKIDASVEREHQGDSHSERDLAHRIRRHVRAGDLDKAGLGILVEVEEDEGDRVLVWLR